MRRAVTMILSLLVAAGASACSSPTSSSPDFDVTLTANPDPASATASSGVQYKVTNPDSTVSYFNYQWSSYFTVTIQENAGLALDITQLNATVQQATGGIVIPPSGGDQVYFKFTSTAAVNHINAKGSAPVTFQVWYTLPNGSREALVTTAFNFTYTDSSNNVTPYSKTFDVKIAP
jgi:ABC-type glycerol-3-phosphate transport system substrate-binding protein